MSYASLKLYYRLKIHFQFLFRLEATKKMPQALKHMNLDKFLLSQLILIKEFLKEE
jgi:hypothetical protein